MSREVTVSTTLNELVVDPPATRELLIEPSQLEANVCVSTNVVEIANVPVSLEVSSAQTNILEGTTPVILGSTESNRRSYIADEALSGHRVVVLIGGNRVVYGDKDTADHAHRVVGLTLHAASADAAVNVLHTGEVTDPALPATLGTVWLGGSGMLTQVVPQTGFSMILGYVVAPNVLFFDPEPAVFLI